MAAPRSTEVQSEATASRGAFDAIGTAGLDSRAYSSEGVQRHSVQQSSLPGRDARHLAAASNPGLTQEVRNWNDQPPGTEVPTSSWAAEIPDEMCNSTRYTGSYPFDVAASMKLAPLALHCTTQALLPHAQLAVDQPTHNAMKTAPDALVAEVPELLVGSESRNLYRNYLLHLEAEH